MPLGSHTDCSARAHSTRVFNSRRSTTRNPIYSTRVTIAYRAVGLLEGDKITWFWIGNHDDYDRLLKSL
jgi:hypothetical protein